MLASALLLASALAGEGKGFDYYAWERVIKKHVHPGAIIGVHTNTVEYDHIAKDADFWEAVRSLQDVDLDNITPEESFAIGCNAYNIYSIKIIIDNACVYEDGQCKGPIYGLPGIVPSAYSDPKFDNNNIGGKNFTINEIEGMLRPTPSYPLFRQDVLPIKEDLRVHSCMVCDGVSCPDVLMYHPDTIDADLDASVKGWMHNPFKGMRIDTSNNTVFFSRIMLWFKDEFDAQGGVLEAYSEYLSDAANDYFATNTNYTMDYLGYVWDANGPIPCPCDGYNATSPEIQKNPAAHVSYYSPSTTMNTREDVVQDIVEPQFRKKNLEQDCSWYDACPPSKAGTTRKA